MVSQDIGYRWRRIKGRAFREGTQSFTYSYGCNILSLQKKKMKPWPILKFDKPGWLILRCSFYVFILSFFFFFCFYTFLCIFIKKWTKIKSWLYHLTIQNRDVLLGSQKGLEGSQPVSEWQAGWGIYWSKPSTNHTAGNKQKQGTYLARLRSHNPSAHSPCRGPSVLGPDAPTPPRLETQPHPGLSPTPETTQDLRQHLPSQDGVTNSARMKPDSREESASAEKPSHDQRSLYQWALYWCGSCKVTKNRSWHSPAILKSLSMNCLH